ncbi:unnamed protein product [Moneuplotes crassus]|uniref:Uncharacterized protein n=1 Tax=Euplotes crassus TaxID=5936 RepID=A0AAD2D719_EUPCR|nr:unnamed protein product [Moneuplotes crassus]
MEDNILNFFNELATFRKDVVRNPYEIQQEIPKPKPRRNKKKGKNDEKSGGKADGKPRLEIKDTKESYIDLLQKLSKAGENAKAYSKPKDRPDTKGEKKQKISQFKQNKSKRNKIKKWKAKEQSKKEDSKNEN